MESILSAMKFITPIFLTPIINRVISTFRIRQLYLASTDIHPCALPDSNGFVACLHVYNKGKDKENKVEITIPNTSTCQIISGNYPSATSKANTIHIDRIIPKQEITLVVFFDSKVGLSSAIKPFIKSEDTNGKSFNDKSHVPPSLGPAVMGLSFLAAITITFFYLLFSGKNILYPYHSFRYSKLYEQGIAPLQFSDNEFISHSGINDSPPIKIGSPIFSTTSIIIPVTIKNVTERDINVTISENLGNKLYQEETDRATQDIHNLTERVEAWRSIDRKYGYSRTDEKYLSDIIIKPSEERTISISRTPTPTTTLNNFNLRISIKKGNYSDPSFNDRYDFNASNSPEATAIENQIKALQKRH